MLNGQKKDKKPRNFVVTAAIRAGRKCVVHGKTKKADRRAAHQNLIREVYDALANA